MPKGILANSAGPNQKLQNTAYGLGLLYFPHYSASFQQKYLNQYDLTALKLTKGSSDICGRRVHSLDNGLNTGIKCEQAVPSADYMAVHQF